MKTLIKIKPQYIGIYKQYHQYDIFANNQKIGVINFIKKNRVLVIGYFNIFEYYRGQHYGYQVIKHLLSYYKIDCIVGQTLYSSRSFWNKCIKNFNGQRRNITTCDNCSSSFIIPKYKIDNYEMQKLLNIGHEIE